LKRDGYARVSATHQNLDRQLSLLKAAACKRVFREKLSGREGMKRPELEKAIEALGPGDVLVLAEWNRATRSMLDGIRIIERVAARGATFKALDRQWLDLTTPLGKGILAFLSALAEDERARILARANGGAPPPRSEASNSGQGQNWLRTSNAKPSAWCGRARACVR
jgi:DNA invertase Pin-like site-specific DNA recombinase